MEENIYEFDDWALLMARTTDYTLFDILCFEEHYQNLLTFDQNTEIFINQLNN
jgi:hypothetical protein